MAHHQHQQADGARRSSAMQNLLKMFHLSNTPTVPLGEDELNGEADEPPDDQISPLRTTFPHHNIIYPRSHFTSSDERRESLLTRAIRGSTSDEHESPSTHIHKPPRGLSTTSSRSTASMASTAELTSDGFTSPPQSTTPSPSFPAINYGQLPLSKGEMLPPAKVIIAPETKDDKPIVAEIGEAAVEKTLGRKRCIMFACGGRGDGKPSQAVSEPKKQEAPATDPPKRKCMLTFACPSRTSIKQEAHTVNKGSTVTSHPRPPPSALIENRRRASPTPGQRNKLPESTTSLRSTLRSPTSLQGFYEFGTSNDEPDAWVDQPIEHRKRLTLTDCMKKENAIRKLGEEAEQEAEEEEQEEEELENELEETTPEDDFAPSDQSSDAGNESDDENGFAESDDESDAGSEYQFWAPSTTTAATSTDNINISHFSSRQRSTASSPESTPPSSRWAAHEARRTPSRRRLTKLAKMRPATPELPDSTDFVCGTLDEDRPLEQAYISCREQRKREKHVPIPQDIDPSFPTTDPEDNLDDDEEVEETDDHLWLKDQLNGFDEENVRGRRKPSMGKASPIQSPQGLIPVVRPTAIRSTFRHSPPPKHIVHRSPPPKPRMARSPPPPRRLFGHSPTRLRSPPAPKRLNSPRGSPDEHQTGLGLGGSRLAQRPNMGRTASLPRTPNPFFRNYSSKTPLTSTVTSGAVTPCGGIEHPRPDMHVRGPVDIVIGLEKKRQKRKEKFWRQHCRKAAKEQAQRRPIPGRGAERMKELGIECAERARGYGCVGQQAQLVISL